MTLVAGVDSSTQSTKVELRDLDGGEVVASASAPHPATSPPRSEHDPAAWWAAFEAAWAAVGSPSVAAIAVGGQQHGMVALDADLQVIRPAKLWNDTESAPDAGWLRTQLEGGAKAWAAAVGSVPVASFTITKLSWLHRSEPEAWSRLAHVLLPHDWLTAQLTGQLVTDRGDASGTGYWSPAEGDYRWDLLAIVDEERDWTGVVPRVLGPTEPAGRWGDVVVGPGTGDNMAGALGLALQPGDAAMSIGTSGTAAAVSDQPTADATGAVAGFADATGRYLPLVCTLNAARVLDTVAGWIGVDHAELDRLALSTDSGGVTLLPYFDGERTPDLPDATGWITGVRTGTTRAQLARAAVEAVACGMLDALDALAEHAVVDGRIVLTGGGARSRALQAVLAALCERPMGVSTAADSVATGACVQAAAVLGERPPLDVAAAWGLGELAACEPAVRLDRDEVRGRYAALRTQAYGG